MWAGLVLGAHFLFRLAYVVGVGVALTRQKRDQVFTRREGIEAGFRRFKRGASIVMNADAVTFVLLCLVTRGTLSIGVSAPILIATGAVLVILGVTIKLWAAARLGAKAYYWHDFFAPGVLVAPDPPGPYRYLKNPMYTVGYLHAYGAALAFGSLPALCAAAIDQIAILVFHVLVEKPHYEQLVEAARRGAEG